MIRYALQCDHGHPFEAWFRSGADFDKGETECPVCGSLAVSKAVMAPQVARKDRGEAARPAEAKSETTKSEKLRLATADPRQQAMIAAIKELRRQVTENADYVGDKFAEEARKIHYEEAEKRGIYGEATGDEAKALVEEGIEVHPLPVLPEDRN
jgi:hypothetical protein